MSSISLNDKTYMSVIVSALKQLVGRTFPNPPVASIVVESNNNFTTNKIVSHGFTSFSGRPHAEFNAIKGVKFTKNKKYTLYSTLEPCCHQGRGESCVSQIIKKKFIKRVVFSISDPDKRVNGQGKKELLNNNIEVQDGFLTNEVKEIYKGYFFNRILKRPRIFLKLATSIDGYISKKNRRTNITGTRPNNFTQILRSKMDAILVGSKTVKIDNCKLITKPKGLQKFSPIRVILNKKLDLDISLRIFKNCKKFRTIIFTSISNEKKISFFSKLGIEVISIKKDKYNLKNILERLSSLGVCNLLVEGGAKIFTSFLKEKLFDDLYIYRSSFFIGNQGLNATGEEKFDLSKIKLLKKKIMLMGDDTLEIFTKKNN